MITREPQITHKVETTGAEAFLRDDWYETWVAESERVAGFTDGGRVVDPFLLPEEPPC